MMNRRYFLAAGAGSLVSLGLPLTTLATMSTKTPAIAGIDPNLKAECKVYRDGQELARLNLVGLSTPSSLDPRLEQYTLNFEAVVPVDLAEASYELFHPTLGRFDAFLQPCGTLNIDQHDGLQYRACMAILR